jgi:hypothetical protein
MRLTSPTSTAFTQYFVVLRTKDSAGAGAPPVCGEGCVLAPKGLVRVIEPTGSPMGSDLVVRGSASIASRPVVKPPWCSCWCMVATRATEPARHPGHTIYLSIK